MGRTPHWVGDHLWRLLNWDLNKLQDYYPGYSRNKIGVEKRYWTKKLIAGEIQMPKTPETGPESPKTHEGKLVKTWEVAMRGADGEWDTTTLHAYDHTEDTVEQWEPVEPAKIRPTKLRRAKRASKFILAYGDAQIGWRRRIDPITDETELIPLHNEAALRVIHQINAVLRPEITVSLGDMIDFAELSRFENDSDHFHKTLGPSLRTVHDFYAQLVADNPDAEHHETDSNHAVRPKRKMLKDAPWMYDLVLPGETEPISNYYRLANLGRLGIRFHDGYGAAEYVYNQDGNAIVFKHGTHSSSNPGATVRKEAAENPTVNVVRGHGHSEEHVTQVRRDGQVLQYWQLPSTCINNGPVPGYASAIGDDNRPVQYHNRRHSNGLLVIEHHPNDQYTFTLVSIVNGIANFRGQEFDGNEVAKE